MKYCIPYYKDFRYKDVIDEVIYDYNAGIVDMITKENWAEGQTIIINVAPTQEEKDALIPTIKMCKRVHNNCIVRITAAHDEIREELNSAEIPYFYANCANTADEVYGLIKKGASEVYITESLGFNIIKVGEYCKSKNVKVRVIPNIAQYKVGFKEVIPDSSKFFIRPEDTELYEPYVDVFELGGAEDRLSVTYEIYRNKQWMGDLSKLIVGFTEPFQNGGLVPHFGSERLKCGQRCMQEKCNLCQQMKELSQKFKDNELIITREKNKEWKNETESYQKVVQYFEDTTSTSNDKISKE
jgi:hypothetical protein